MFIDRLGAEMQHRKAKRKLFRRTRCTCGLPWPCLELTLVAIRNRPQPEVPGWAAPTRAVPQVGRAGNLTPAQEYRASGGSGEAGRWVA
ncbi:hypothetical protein Areg01_51580 [Actinoplanes regularis]|nr:hypothetical protein Areg01_51580 [Actinoplanes regularis]